MHASDLPTMQGRHMPAVTEAPPEEGVVVKRRGTRPPHGLLGHALPLVLVLAAALTCTALAAGCGGSNQMAPHTTAPSTETSQHGHFVVSYKPDAGQMAVNQLQSWTVHIETPAGAPVDAAKITVGGGMADMGHGLPTAPSVSRSGGGDYRVQGLEFSMPGAWTVTFAVAAGGVSDQASFQLYLQ